MKINMVISRELDKVINKKIIKFGNFIRLKCGIQFEKGNSNLTKPMLGIVDTGAPISVIPYDMWSDLDKEILAEYEMRGIVPKEECKTSVYVGKVKCVLVDNLGTKSKMLEIYAYLAQTNLVPLIIGFKNLLEEFKIVIEYKLDNAYLENVMR